jgi:hypothetical protein
MNHELKPHANLEGAQLDLSIHSISNNCPIDQKLDKFVDSFRRSNNQVETTGLCARILRGVSDKCFSTLSPDPGRKVVMLTDASEVLKLAGKSIEQILMCIGYSQSDIHAKLVEEKNSFKVLVANTEGSLKLANWDGVFEVACIVYPHLADKLLMQKEVVTKLPFDRIQNLAGYSFSEVQNYGITDPRFMTEERFAKSIGNVVDVRAFFYHTFQLRELYSGDGYTRKPCGQVGVIEYIAPNILLDSLKNYRLIDL